MGSQKAPLTPTTGHPDLPREILDHVAVVICTRHRPPQTSNAVVSVLEARPSAGLIIIVDQADPGSSDPLEGFDAIARVTRIHHRGTGLSRARNIGAAAAEAAGASIVAYTDDDCTVKPGWLGGLVSGFAMAKDVSMVFGSTKAAAHNSRAGIIPAYTVTKAASHRGLASIARVEGMGACMAIRIDAWRTIGGFDDRLGSGTTLCAAEENDFAMRLLLAGFTIAQTPAAVVLHHGYRDGPAATSLQASYMRGSGAVFAKMVRVAQWQAAQPLAAIGRRWLRGSSAVQMGPLPSRMTRLRSALQGARAGWMMPIDSRTARFLPFMGPDDLLMPAEKLPANDSERYWRTTAAALDGPLPHHLHAIQASRSPSLLGWISAHQMVWLFNRQLTAWMIDRTLRRQLPFWHRMFSLYCVTWATIMPSAWIVGGKQLFFLCSALHRLVGGPRICVMDIADTKIGLNLSDPRFIKVVHEVLPDSSVVVLLNSLLQPGDSFVDIGSNHGAYSLAAARIIGPDGVIIAIEAQSHLASLLERSLSASASCRYEIHPIAVGNQPGVVPFYILWRNSGESGMFWGPSSAGRHSSITVPMERLDDAIGWQDLPGRVVIKIDVEGAEDLVLAGAVSFLTARRPVIVLEVNQACMAAAGVTWSMLSNRLRRLGYHSYSEVATPQHHVPLESIDPGVQRDIIVWPAESGIAQNPPAASSITT